MLEPLWQGCILQWYIWRALYTDDILYSFDIWIMLSAEKILNLKPLCYWPPPLQRWPLTSAASRGASPEDLGRISLNIVLYKNWVDLHIFGKLGTHSLSTWSKDIWFIMTTCRWWVLNTFVLNCSPWSKRGDPVSSVVAQTTWNHNLHQLICTSFKSCISWLHLIPMLYTKILASGYADMHDRQAVTDTQFSPNCTAKHHPECLQSTWKCCQCFIHYGMAIIPTMRILIANIEQQQYNDQEHVQFDLQPAGAMSHVPGRWPSSKNTPANAPQGGISSKKTPFPMRKSVDPKPRLLKWTRHSPETQLHD